MSISPRSSDFEPPLTPVKPAIEERVHNGGMQALRKGLVLRFKKEIPQAIEVLEKAHRLFSQHNNVLGEAFALIELAWLHGSMHEWHRSDKMFREAEALVEAHAQTPDMSEARARLLHYRGLLYYQEEDYGQALKLFKESLSFCDPNGLETAKIYDSLGVHYERTGDFHRAVRYLKSALFIKTQLGDPPHEEAITCQILGRLHLLYEDYDLAFQHLQRSLEISAELKDEKRKASLKNEMIRLFLRCGNEDRAMQLIHDTRHECANRHLKIQYTMAGFYEAYLHYQRKQAAKAEQLLEREVLPMFQKFRYRKGLAMAKRLRAWVRLALDSRNVSTPVALMGEAIELFRQENMIDEVAKTHFELGKLYHALGNEKLALASLMDTLKLAEENGLFYLTPYVEDEIFRTHEPQWKEIVNKRSRHERIFEKRNSLIEALSALMEGKETRETMDPALARILSTDPGTSEGLPFLVSLLKVGQAMAAERDLDKLLQLIREETVKALNAEHCRVFLYDADTNELWSRTMPEPDQVEEIRFPAHQGLAGYVAKTGEPLNIQNAGKDPRFNPKVDGHSGMQITSLLCVPMRNRKSDIIGVFQVLNKRQAMFKNTDEELLKAIATNAGIALENAQLYRELKITFESFIGTLSSTIDARDPITAGHSERVMEYAMMIGEQMQLPDDEMEVLKYAALLHDIGKIGVKEEILVKEGRLTENEYRHIQQHVFYTYQILKNIHFEKHLSTIPEVAASHHEKLDGSGYFRGLKGEQIPLGGRILAVADVFDAITSRRQYRNRMPFDRVVAILRNEAGTHFDAEIVETFLEGSLRQLARVLCMDKHLTASERDIEQALDGIAEDMTILRYLDVLASDGRSPEDEQTHANFTRLYHFAEISSDLE